MSNSELPQHYGKKTSDGELIKRPVTPPEVLSSPRRIYFPPNITYSPENAHPADIDEPHGQDYARPGLRPRPSNNTHLGRRYSDDDNDRERPSFTQGNPGGSRTIGASRDDGWYRDDDRDRDHSRAPLRREEHMSHAHPDSFERSRPPRSHRNVDWEKQAPGSASKPYFDESRGEYRLDLERGKDDLDSPSKRSRHRKRSEESIDGYDYDKHNRKNTIDLKNLTKEQRAEVLRLPWTQWMNSEVKNHFVATTGEFVGTTMFLFFAFAGTQVANIGSTASANGTAAGTTTGGSTGFDISVYLYISVIFGFSLMVNVWVFFRISGGLFNPAVTVGMVLVGAIPVPRAICLFAAQILGGIAASAMVLGMFPTQFNVRTTLGPGTSLVQGVFIEGILTAELVFTIFMLAKEKHKATFIAPVGIGLALFIAEMVGVFYTGGSLNPARSLGPCVVTATFDKEHWIYWIGPLLGSLIAVFFYKVIKILEYEMANPGQDGDPLNDPTKNEEKRVQMKLERHASMHP